VKRIVIIGTIHQSTKNYSALDLFKILEKIQPDIIFEELPPELAEDQTKINIPFGKWCEFQERAANHWYFNKYNIPIIPVDLPNRNQLYNESGTKELYLFWSQLLNDKRLNLEEKINLEEYFSVLEEQRMMCENKTAKEINSPKMDSLVAIKRNFLRGLGPTLIDKYSYDQKMKEYLEKLNIWTESREEHMTQEMIKYMKKYKNGVFPVGADHRPGLIEKLKQHSEEIKYLDFKKSNRFLIALFFRSDLPNKNCRFR